MSQVHAVEGVEGHVCAGLVPGPHPGPGHHDDPYTAGGVALRHGLQVMLVFGVGLEPHRANVAGNTALRISEILVEGAVNSGAGK